MKSKCSGKHLAKLIFIGSLLTTLIVLTIFPENIVQNFTLKVRYSQNSQMVNVTNLSVDSFTCKPSNILTHQSFAKLMRSFPWIPYKNATILKNITEIKKYSELLLTSILIPFIIKEPPTPINTSCKAPPLPSQPEECTSHKNGSPPKIGVILNFGFDVDALEVHLQELDYIVDKFFLVEGLKINNRFLNTKPSIWDLVKYTSRFSQFHSKIVHLIVDDADYHEGSLSPGLWDRERSQGELRLKKFLEWNQATGYFSANDWIGIGDTDEIPSRQTINLLKNCELKGGSDGGFDIGIWFPFPYDDTIFVTDFPVHSHPHTLGNPTYWKVSAVERIYRRKSGTGRRAGQGKHYLLGGMHFSMFPYLPFQLTKLVTGSESEMIGIKWVIDIGMKYLNGTDRELDIDEVPESIRVETVAQKKWEKLMTKKISNERITNLENFRKRFGDQETDDIVKIPWFYQCNPGRYAGFKRELDKRLF